MWARFRRLRSQLPPFNGRELAKDTGTAVILASIGDVVCQRVVESRAEINARRVLAITAFTGGYSSFLHFLYQTYPLAVTAAAARLPPARSALAARLASRKTLAHSLSCAVIDNVHCGLIYIPAYFVGVGLLQGDGLKSSVRNLKTELVPSYVSCSAFWVPFMWFNFQKIPPAGRVRFMAMGNLIWCVLIDHIAHRSLLPDGTTDAAERGTASPDTSTKKR